MCLHPRPDQEVVQMSDPGSEKIGVVVVGTGFGVLTHVRALRAAGLPVVALVGRDPRKTAERAARFEIPHASTSFGKALALPGVRAVTIATPPHTHAKLALAAIRAGKHVLCEKPFAKNAREARRLLDAAERAGIVHLLGTEFRWATGQALLARVVASGRIGRPRLATFLLHAPMLADPKAEVPEWWSDASQGGGWLGAYATHVVDQIRTTLGEFEGVSAALPVVAERDWTADDGYSVRFRLRSGVDGILQSTAADWGPFLAVARIVGSSGSAWSEGDAVKVADRTGTHEVPVPEDLRLPPPSPPPGDLLHTAYDMLHAGGIDLGPYTRLCELFRDRILGRAVAKDPLPPTFADGVASMAVIDAIRRSAARGRWVAVADAPRRPGPHSPARA
jgi:predicted dehydrogenase